MNIPKIGGISFYDDDIDLIYDFIKSKSDPIAMLSVFKYYESRIISYWSKILEYVSSDKSEEDLQKHNAFVRHNLKPYDREKIRANWPIYTEAFNKLLEFLTQEYHRLKRLPTEVINFIFENLAVLMCMNASVWESMILNLDPRKLSGRIYSLDRYEYVLPNGSGIFGFNTWLFAFFNGISLIGVPDYIQEYDNKIGCPGQFYYHDRDHNYNISDYNYPLLKSTYRFIIDTPLLQIEKELHILVMWVLIHEITFQTKSPYFYEPTEFIELLENKIDGIYDTVISLYPEIVRFVDFAYSPNNINEFKTYDQFELLKFEHDTLTIPSVITDNNNKVVCYYLTMFYSYRYMTQTIIPSILSQTHEVILSSPTYQAEMGM